jgi:hypothetical protein
MTQYSVAVLAKGAAIGCELRLVLGHLVASETYVLGDTLH